MYLTPARFREMGFGIDISELNDAEVLAYCHQATTVIDAYCNVPRIPQHHDFRGGTISGEQHSWMLPKYSTDAGQRRVYPFHWPILTVDSLRIHVTNTQYVDIGASELFINNSERWVEVVSYAMTSVGIFGALVVPSIGLMTPVAKIGYTYGWDFVVNDEYLTFGDGQTWRAQNQFWHTTDDAEGNSRDPVIKKNGVIQTSGYTVDPIEGAVVFDTDLTDTDTVSASYHHKLPRDISWAAGHIVAHLHGQAELHARGMAHLKKLRVAEVEMTSFDPPKGKDLAANLDSLVPEAALLLSGYAADYLTVR